jgi:hypothetical protein
MMAFGEGFFGNFKVIAQHMVDAPAIMMNIPNLKFE